MLIFIEDDNQLNMQYFKLFRTALDLYNFIFNITVGGNIRNADLNLNQTAKLN